MLWNSKDLRPLESHGGLSSCRRRRDTGELFICASHTNGGIGSHKLRDKQKYKLLDPLDPEATLGPLVNVSAANRVRAEIQDALSKGARGLIDPSSFPLAQVFYFLP